MPHRKYGNSKDCKRNHRTDKSRGVSALPGTPYSCLERTFTAFGTGKGHARRETMQHHELASRSRGVGQLSQSQVSTLPRPSSPCSAAWTLFDTMQARRRRALLPRGSTRYARPGTHNLKTSPVAGHRRARCTGTRRDRNLQTHSNGPTREAMQPTLQRRGVVVDCSHVVSHSVHHQRPATWLAQGRRARQTPSTASGKPRLGLAAPRGVPGASLLTVCTVGGELPAVCNERLVL